MINRGDSSGVLATAKKPKKKNGLFQFVRRRYILYLLLVPMVIYFLVFNYYPMLGLQIAFKDWVIPIGGRPGGQWGSPWATTNGKLDLFKHFKTLFQDKEFFTKFINTLRIAGLRMLCGFPVPIILTILMNELTSSFFKKSVQTISYLPHFISWVIISGVLISMTASKSAFQNFMVVLFGKEIHFFSNSNLFVAMVIISNIWKNAGWGTIIYLAAITNINPELYESAAIDGANRWQKIRHITLPGIGSAITINLILQIGNLVDGGFDQIFNMYNTAVYEKGDILETYLFRIGVTGGRYDIATALGLFNSLIALILTLATNKIAKKLGGEGIW
ncbi:MAG TPA: ABC transporter permease subunit [Clostridia bacterium]